MEFYPKQVVHYKGEDVREYAHIIRELIDICRTTNYQMEKSIKELEPFVDDLEETDKLNLEQFM